MEAGAARVGISYPDPQGVFAGMEPGTQKAIAIPVRDFDLWRGRADVLRAPRFYSVYFDIREDGRMYKMEAIANKRNLMFELCQFVLERTAGYSMTRERPGLLAIDGHPIPNAQIRDFWHIRDSFAAIFDSCLLVAEAAGFFVRCDLDDQEAVAAYPIPPTKTEQEAEKARKRAESEGRTRGVRGASTGRTRGDRGVDVDGRTRTDVDGQGPTITDVVAVSSVNSSASSSASSPGLTKTGEAFLDLVNAIHDVQRANGKPLWPSNGVHRKYLDQAFATALRESSLPALRKLLTEVAEAADSGGLFYTALRDGGWL